MANSWICIGNNPSDPRASGNTCILISFHDGAFIDVSMLPAGRYLFYLRTDLAESINLSAMRAFLSPNLLEKSPPTIITSWIPVAGLGPENLTTNLRSRTSRAAQLPIIDENSTTTTLFKSCFKALIADQTGPLDLNVLSLYFQDEVFVNSVFLALDTLGGVLGSVSTADLAKYLPTQFEIHIRNNADWTKN